MPLASTSQCSSRHGAIAITMTALRQAVRPVLSACARIDAALAASDARIAHFTAWQAARKTSGEKVPRDVLAALVGHVRAHAAASVPVSPATTIATLHGEFLYGSALVLEALEQDFDFETDHLLLAFCEFDTLEDLAWLVVYCRQARPLTQD